MSYTLSKTGAQIDAILNKADAAGIIQKSSATYAGVLAALALGSPVIIQDGADMYQYVGAIGPTLFFSQMSTIDNYIPGAYLKGLALTSQDVWSSTTRSLQDKLTFDSTPTLNSTNPVTSDGTAKAISQAVDASYITDTAQGAIASFPDGADDVPVKSLVAQITPLQDLHGQSAPYPAGGGKNKIPFPYVSPSGTVSGGITFTTDAQGRISASGTTGTTVMFVLMSNVVLPAGTYTFSTDKASSEINVVIRNETTATNLWSTRAAGSYTFTANGTDGYTVRLTRSTSSLVVSFSGLGVQLETGSTATDWTPYSNVCPISGWTGSKITDTGINIWDEEWVDGYWDATDGSFVSSVGVWRASKNFIPCSPNTTYFRKMEATITASAAGVLFYDADKTYINYINVAKNTTFTTPSNAYYMTFYANANFFSYPLSINYPSTDTSYHSGTSNKSVDVDWTDEAGTVYGGTLTYLGSGKYSLQQIMARVDLGTLTWAESSNNRVSSTGIASVVKRPPDANTAANILAEKYKTYSTNGMVTDGIIGVSINPTSGNIIARTGSSDNPTGYMIYELATLPDPIILDAEDVKTLLGDNNIFVDTGSVEVEYRASTKLYIDKMLGQ